MSPPIKQLEALEINSAVNNPGGDLLVGTLRCATHAESESPRGLIRIRYKFSDFARLEFTHVVFI